MRVPVGRRNLLAERRRAMLGIAGVAAAMLIVLALDGILAGSMRQLTRYIDTSRADVFLAQRGTRNMHMATSAVPLASADRIRTIGGVAWVDPILFETDVLLAGPAKQISYVIGYEPGRHGGPVSITRGSAPGPGEMVLDERGASALRVRIGSSVRAINATWRVSGLTSGMTNIVNSIAYVRFQDFASARRDETVTNYLLVGARRGADPDGLAARLGRATGLEALTRGDFSRSEARIVRDMTVDLMQIMTLAAFVIGLATIGLTLYAATLSRLREVGVMKALGASSGRLGRIVLSQAVWTVCAAAVLALALTWTLGIVVGRLGGTVSILVEPASALRAFAGGAILGALGAVAPLVKVARVDPASVFRR